MNAKNWSNTRNELKNFRKYLIKNKWWICDKNRCNRYCYRNIYGKTIYRDLCNTCQLFEMVDEAYKNNKKADLFIFSNCRLSFDFYDLYYNYCKRQNKENSCNIL